MERRGQKRSKREKRREQDQDQDKTVNEEVFSLPLCEFLREVVEDVATCPVPELKKSADSDGGIKQETEADGAEGDLGHAALGGSIEVVKDGKHVDLAREGKHEDRNRLDDVERTAADPQAHVAPWRLDGVRRNVVGGVITHSPDKVDDGDDAEERGEAKLVHAVHEREGQEEDEPDEEEGDG
eukprot:768031-Hanusia_phi.AAC.3